MAPLTDFVRQLLTEQGFTQPMAPEVRAELEGQLLDRATNFLNRRLIDAMPDQTAAHLNALLESNPSPQAVQEFMQYNVPNREHVVVQALVEFRKLYLGDKA